MFWKITTLDVVCQIVAREDLSNVLAENHLRSAVVVERILVMMKSPDILL